MQWSNDVHPIKYYSTSSRAYLVRHILTLKKLLIETKITI